MIQSDINYFGKVNFRNQQNAFGLKSDDRTRHMYVVGKTGMGKTALLQNMAIQDIVHNRGVGVIDPHGEFAERLLEFVPAHRIEDVVYINPADTNYPVGINLLENVGYDQRHIIASGLVGIFKKIWVDVWSPRMEYILSNAILALIEYPDATLLDVNKLMTNRVFRKKVMTHVTDPIVKEFWLEQFVNWGERLSGEATASVENKVGQFTAAPLTRNIVGQPESTINFREIMDGKKILIVNLSKGYIGEENSRLLGAMIITKLYLSAMERINVAEGERANFALYVDEFQNFASNAFEDILSEARKYHLSLILAHQYIEQMDEGVQRAIFGNVGTLVTFRVGATDAEFLEKEFAPNFTAEDLVNLGRFHILLRLMIDGIASTPFSATTLEPFDPTHSSYRDFILQTSRKNWAIAREQIEDLIQQRIAHLKEDAQQEQGGVVVSSGSNRSEPAIKESELRDAVCTVCQKITKTIFEPERFHEVKCRKCRKKEKKAKEEAQQERSQQKQIKQESSKREKKEQRVSPEKERVAEQPATSNKEQESKNEEKKKIVVSHQEGRLVSISEIKHHIAQTPPSQETITIEETHPSTATPPISLADAVRKYPAPRKVRYSQEIHERYMMNENAYTTSRPPTDRAKKQVDIKGLRALLEEVIQENKAKGVVRFTLKEHSGA